ncbi:MAG: cysteine desulfurase family protein [Verrucomicrobiia bacterium]
MIYFDYNATAPLLPEAKAVWLDAVDRYFANPSSQHRLGSRAYKAISDAREELALKLGCHPLEIIWTGGATEAANTIINHFHKTLPETDCIWVSSIEHPAVMEPANLYFKGRVRFIPVDKDGVVSVDWIESNLKRERPGAIIVMAVNNESGVVQPFKKISAICSEHNIRYFCDASQWIGKLLINELACCEFLCAGAHKFGGPRGIGFLKSASPHLTPLLYGGGQEEGRRAGTENVPAILSMIAALNICEQRLSENIRSVDSLEHSEPQFNPEPLQPSGKIALRKEFEEELLREIPEIKVVGNNSERIWNTVSLVMPDVGCNIR